MKKVIKDTAIILGRYLAGVVTVFVLMNAISLGYEISSTTVLFYLCGVGLVETVKSIVGND